MERVEEYSGNVHFFKLLFQLAAQNQVTLKVPDTYISGFGFANPVLMTSTPAGMRFTQVLNFSHMLDQLFHYDDKELGALPHYVLKRRGAKSWLYSKHEAIRAWERLTNKEDFVLQPFLISPSGVARLVRVTWTQLRGTTAKLLSSKHPFLKAKENIQQTVRFAGISAPELMDVDERYLQVNETAEETDCTISQATEHLAATVEYVRLILEKTVLQGFSGRISSLTIDVLPDIQGKWYFLCIDSYQLGILKKQKPVEPASARTLSTHRSDRKSKIISEIQSPSLPVRDLRLKLKSSTATAKLTGKVGKELRRVATAEGLIWSGLSSRWTKTLELEDAVSSLIQQKAFRPISHMTYRKWRERTEDEPLRNLDLLYAQKIAKKAPEAKIEAEASFKDLVALKTEMLTISAVSTLNPTVLTQVVGRTLLDRAKLAQEVRSTPLLQLPRCHSNPALERYRTFKLQQLGKDRARDTLNQVARRMDALQKKVSTYRLLS
jgi:hypothetical protein